MADDLDDDEGDKMDPYFEKFAGPLGRVILEFNYLEVDAGRMIARLLNQDDVIAALFAGALSFLDKLKLIKAIVPLKIANEELRQDFIALVDEATRVNGLRNRYIHAEYMPLIGPNDELVTMLHQRLKDHGKSIDSSKQETIDDLLQPVDEAALKKLALDIHALAHRTRVLAEKFASSEESVGDVRLR